LFDHTPYSPDFAPIDYNLFTDLKNWLRSQRFNNNEELTEGVKTRQSSQAADFFDTVYFVYNNFFLTACFVSSSPEVTFQIALTKYYQTLHITSTIQQVQQRWKHAARGSMAVIYCTTLEGTAQLFSLYAVLILST
jgi:hypothetical protein